jgi:carbonic anhydrase
MARATIVKLGKLTGLLDRIKPAIETVPQSVQPRNSKNPKFLDMVTEANVRESLKQVREKSPIIREMIDRGEVALVGGIYDISTGKVTFFD